MWETGGHLKNPGTYLCSRRSKGGKNNRFKATVSLLKSTACTPFPEQESGDPQEQKRMKQGGCPGWGKLSKLTRPTEACSANSQNPIWHALKWNCTKWISRSFCVSFWNIWSRNTEVCEIIFSLPGSTTISHPKYSSCIKQETLTHCTQPLWRPPSLLYKKHFWAHRESRTLSPLSYTSLYAWGNSVA